MLQWVRSRGAMTTIGDRRLGRIMLDRNHIIAEIRRTTQENGGQTLGASLFSDETGISRNYWEGKFWVCFGDALKEAGYAPNEFGFAYEENFLIDKLIELIRELGHFPKRRELVMKSHSDPNFPSPTPFRRLGKTKAALAGHVLRHCEQQPSPAHEDVTAICASICAETKAEEPNNRIKTQELSQVGFVYLMKFQRHYKIGRSNAPGRRERELAIQLPDKTKMVHTIKTDDPVGIERYWHQRFECKRGNGEWFKLDRTDVAAFKQRKFM